MPNIAVVSMAIGDHYQRLAQITYPTISRYADKMGAKFIVITEHKVSDTPSWERFQLLEYLGIYDRILYLDADVLVRRCCPNIFDIVPETHMGVFNEAPFANREDDIRRCAESYNLKDFEWDGKYYNMGVMVVSRCHRFLFQKPEREISDLFFEQSYINLQIQRRKTLIHELDYKFNGIICLADVMGRHRYESCIIHYAGAPARLDPAFTLIKNDLAAIDALPDAP